MKSTGSAIDPSKGIKTQLPHVRSRQWKHWVIHHAQFLGLSPSPLMFFFLPGESPTSPFHTWAKILAVVPKVVQSVWGSGGMVSAGKDHLQSPGWDPKACWTPETRAPLRWET